MMTNTLKNTYDAPESRLTNGFASIERANNQQAPFTLSFTPSNFGAQNKQDFAREMEKAIKEQKVDPSTLSFKGVDLSDADLRHINLRLFGEKALREMNFAGANLGKQNFSGLVLCGANMEGANLQGAHFDDARIEGINLRKANVSGVSFSGTRAQQAKMDGVTAVGTNWEGAFQGASLAGARMTYGYFGNSTFKGANLSGADLTGAMSSDEVDFREATMVRTNLNGDFRGANFANANLTESIMAGGNFNGAVFAGANVTSVDATGASFDRADVAKAIDLTRTHEVVLPKPSFGSPEVQRAAAAAALRRELGAPDLALHDLKTMFATATPANDESPHPTIRRPVHNLAAQLACG